jgi:hypothetical protein
MCTTTTSTQLMRIIIDDCAVIQVIDDEVSIEALLSAEALELETRPSHFQRGGRGSGPPGIAAAVQDAGVAEQAGMFIEVADLNLVSIDCDEAAADCLSISAERLSELGVEVTEIFR